MSWLSSLAGAFLAAQGLFAPVSPGMQAEVQLVQATPAPVIPQTAVPDAEKRIPMAIGLAGVNDWSVQQPFLDVMKTARPWIGHLPGQWGGLGHDDLAQQGLLDDAGWPRMIPRSLGSIGTLILTDLPPEAVSLTGRYRLTFAGKGIVEVSGRAQNVRYGKGEVQFDFTPGPGPVEIRIQRSNKADYVRDISVVKLANVEAFDAGAIFNPDWLARMRGFRALRFMDWMETNDSTQSAWADRPEVSDYTWARKGVPLEIMLALVTELGADGWFNMPHLADDDYVTRFATMTRDRLPTDRQVYVEFSNEVWNWQFDQTRWADAAAQERWGAKDAGVQYYGMRAAEVARIWTGVFQGRENSLVNVVSSQTGWPGLEELVLNAPAWVSEATGNQRPAEAFQAYAVTGYFGGILGTEAGAPMVRSWIADSRNMAQQAALAQGLSGQALETYVERNQYAAAVELAARELRTGSVSGQDANTLADLLENTLTYHAGVARDYGLDLIMYEGGTHIVGLGALVDDPELTAFFTYLNYTPEMGALYGDLIRGWDKLGGQLFNVYVDVYRPNKWGSWGALRYLSDDNPRWDAIVQFR
jgi:hypothetical protein